MDNKYDMVADTIINSASEQSEAESNGNQYLYFFPKSQEDVQKISDALKQVGIKGAETHKSSLSEIPVVRVFLRAVRDVNNQNVEIVYDRLNTISQPYDDSRKLLGLRMGIHKKLEAIKIEARNEIKGHDLDIISNFGIKKSGQNYYLHMNNKNNNGLDDALAILEKHGITSKQDGFRYKLITPTIKIETYLQEVVAVSQPLYNKKQQEKQNTTTQQPKTNKPKSELKKNMGFFARLREVFGRK